MAEHYPAMRGNEVAAVVQARGRRLAVVHAEHASCDPGAVEAIADGVDADRRHDYPHGVEGLAAVQGHAAHGERSDESD
jgi:hypothetical protein